jgi:hypothetical protein
MDAFYRCSSSGEVPVVGRFQHVKRTKIGQFESQDQLKISMGKRIN